MLDAVIDEDLHPLHHWLRRDDVDLFIVVGVEELVALVKDLENAELMIAMDVCQENNLGLEETLIEQGWVSEVIVQLIVAALGTVHENAIASVNHVDA